MSSSNKEQLLLLLAVQGNRKIRRCWVNEINRKRETLEEYHRLYRELQSHRDRFFSSSICFEELHDLLQPNIEKCRRNRRKPIGTKEMLVICLR